MRIVPIPPDPAFFHFACLRVFQFPLGSPVPLSLEMLPSFKNILGQIVSRGHLPNFTRLPTEFPAFFQVTPSPLLLVIFWFIRNRHLLFFEANHFVPYFPQYDPVRLIPRFSFPPFFPFLTSFDHSRNVRIRLGSACSHP